MTKYIKEIKAVFSPKDIRKLLGGKEIELIFGSKELEIYIDGEVYGSYSNGIPNEIENEIMQSIYKTEEYDDMYTYSMELGLAIRHLIHPVHNHSSIGLGVTLWIEL